VTAVEAGVRLPKTAAMLERICATGAAGAQVVVVAPDRSRLVLSDGLAGPDRPLHVHTRVPWLCAGKPALGVLFLQLAADGAVDLDAAVTDFLPGGGARSGEVTLRHLLTHTAGLAEPEAAGTDPAEPDEPAGWDVADGFTPGWDWRYSPKLNWFLLARVAEGLLGGGLETALRDRVLAPFGLTTVDTAGPAGSGYDQLRYRLPSPSGRAWLPPSRLPASRPDPSGRLTGTLDDLVTWYETLMRSLDGAPGPVPGPVLHEAISLTPPAGSQVQICSEGFGVGFMVGMRGYLVSRYSSAWSFGHLGGLGAANVLAAFADPVVDAAVGILVNNVDHGTIHAIHALGNAVYLDLGLDGRD
jgi:CubicO group peptidase (beta-lactamase class C family)